VVRPLIRTLFISGYTESAAVQVGHIDPEDHVLRKPFTPTGLARKVREVLDETSTVN
jgi:two-component SAPR family response regulator